MIMEKLFQKMQADRFATQTLGAVLLEVQPGYAKVQLVVEEKHLNAVGLAQGGALFTLADFTFAAAGNTGDDEVVAIETSMSFLKPVRLGSVVTATATEISRSKRLVSYDVILTNEKDEPVAKFYGRGYVREPLG